MNHKPRTTNHEPRIAFVVPYFGRFPNYFPLWLKTCEPNTSIDFIIFTNDRTSYSYPPNVKVHYMRFPEVRKIFQSHFDFRISLENPYKLCDYKPLYGEMFQEYLKPYDFWGHCDIDLLWGNIRKFVTNDKLENYERIYSYGHCTLYRNTPEVNSWYRTLNPGRHMDYRKILTSSGYIGFDESAADTGGGMNSIVRENGKRFYTNDDSADVITWKTSSFIVPRKEELKKKDLYFVWENGSIYGCSTGKPLLEVLYVHLHKTGRILYSLQPIQKARKFFVFPPGVATCNDIHGHTFKLMLLEIVFKLYFAPDRAKRFVKSMIPQKLKGILRRVVYG